MNRATLRSLRLKIALLLSLILPFNILGLISSKMSYDNALDRVDDMITYTLRSYGDILSQRLNDADNTMRDMVENDSYFITAAQQDTSWRYDFSVYQVYITLQNHIVSTRTADHFFIYVNKRNDLIQIPYASDPIEVNSYFSFGQPENSYQSVGQWILIQQDSCQSLVKINYDPIFDVYYGSIIDLQSTIQDLSGAIDFESTKFTFSSHSQNSTSNDIVWSIPIIDNVFINASISRQEMGHTISPLQYLIFVLFAIFLFLVPVLFMLIRHYVISPLTTLNYAHDQLAAGNEAYRVTEAASSSEFENAFESFNHMASTLQSLRRDLVDKEISNKQLQIDYLQMQIRPHFLLNTFNVLFTLIQKNDRENAEKLILYLSDYFRHIFRSGHELQPFINEMELIHGYLDVAQIYYPGAFTVSYQIDPLIHQIQLPPLLLHSFVENIIQHALVPDRVVHIILSGEWTDEYILFFISDDGCGMSQEAIEHLNHMDFSDGQHVGLKNAIGRLRHYFGGDASVSVESGINEGTTFTIRIPYRLEEYQNDSAFGQ